jgi:hypothetical protein
MSWNVVKLERLTPLSSDDILPTITLHTKEQLDVERRSPAVRSTLHGYARVSCADTAPLVCSYWILQERPRDRKAHVDVVVPACTHSYLDTNVMMEISWTRSHRRRKPGPCLRSVKNHRGSRGSDEGKSKGETPGRCERLSD